MAGIAQQLGHGIDDGQDRAHLNREHHGVFPLDVGPKHDKRLPERVLQQLRLE
jgi:hypothetical protein